MNPQPPRSEPPPGAPDDPSAAVFREASARSWALSAAVHVGLFALLASLGTWIGVKTGVLPNLAEFAVESARRNTPPPPPPPPAPIRPAPSAHRASAPAAAAVPNPGSGNAPRLLVAEGTGDGDGTGDSVVSGNGGDGNGRPVAPVVARPAPPPEPAPPPVRVAPRARGNEHDGPVRVTEDVVPPEPLADNPRPAYPEDAKTAGVQGTVVVQLEVDEDGNVSDLEVLEGPEILRAVALETLRRWRYRPARIGNDVIAMTHVERMDFRLENL